MAAVRTKDDRQTLYDHGLARHYHAQPGGELGPSEQSIRFVGGEVYGTTTAGRGAGVVIAYVWVSPFGANIHETAEKTATTSRPINRLHL